VPAHSSCNQSVGGLLLAVPARSFAILRSDKSRIDRPGGGFRYHFVAAIYHFFGDRACNRLSPRRVSFRIGTATPCPFLRGSGACRRLGASALQLRRARSSMMSCANTPTGIPTVELARKRRARCRCRLSMEASSIDRINALRREQSTARTISNSYPMSSGVPEYCIDRLTPLSMKLTSGFSDCASRRRRMRRAPRRCRDKATCCGRIR
jgi:hypothetical protein